MLKRTLAASGSMLLSCRVNRFSAFGADVASRKRVVVVGAGFAGLACAHELIAAGYRVALLEARNRFGGRVLSFDDFVAGKNVEGGGELIGSNHPTWIAYANRFALDFLPASANEKADVPVIIQGKKLDFKRVKELLDEMDGAYKTLNEDAAKVNEDEPWKTPGAEAWDRRSTGQWLAALQVSDECRRLIKSDLAGNNGVAVEKQSYLGNLTQIKGGGVEKYWTDTETYRCRGGNQQLAVRLAKAVGEERIRLSSAVSEISVKEAGVRVTCADGHVAEGDDVVLAVPPSVWGKIKIDPALPENLKPQMGTNVKHLAAVAGRFWQKANLSPVAHTDGDISLTWEGTGAQPGEEGAELTSFSGGPAAEACRKGSKEQRDAAYAALLEQLYPGFEKSYVNSRFMDWPAEPLTGAGYSFPAPGQIMTMGPILLAGIGRLHFAGEHACYKFVGYMEGALNSGAALARRIAERDGIAGPIESRSSPHVGTRHVRRLWKPRRRAL